MQKGGNHGSDMAHAASHLCLTPTGTGSGYYDREGIVGTFNRHRHDALTHSNLDSKVAAVGKLAGNCYNPATPCTKMQQSSPKVSQIRR
jgi:hypothetical protein